MMRTPLLGAALSILLGCAQTISAPHADASLDARPAVEARDAPDASDAPPDAPPDLPCRDGGDCEAAPVEVAMQVRDAVFAHDGVLALGGLGTLVVGLETHQRGAVAWVTPQGASVQLIDPDGPGAHEVVALAATRSGSVWSVRQGFCSTLGATCVREVTRGRASGEDSFAPWLQGAAFAGPSSDDGAWIAMGVLTDPILDDGPGPCRISRIRVARGEDAVETRDDELVLELLGASVDDTGTALLVRAIDGTVVLWRGASAITRRARVAADAIEAAMVTLSNGDVEVVLLAPHDTGATTLRRVRAPRAGDPEGAVDLPLESSVEAYPDGLRFVVDARGRRFVSMHHDGSLRVGDVALPGPAISVLELTATGVRPVREVPSARRFDVSRDVNAALVAAPDGALVVVENTARGTAMVHRIRP